MNPKRWAMIGDIILVLFVCWMYCRLAAVEARVDRLYDLTKDCLPMLSTLAEEWAERQKELNQ